MPARAACPAFLCLPSCLQARAEDYCEAVAFVRLLNALWRSSGGAELADEGRSVAHFTKFVREDLLGTAFQRAYREEAQRWQLVAACLEHCELCLAGVRSMGALAGEAAASSSAASLKPPGLEVLLDLLGEWAVWQDGGALQLLHQHMFCSWLRVGELHPASQGASPHRVCTLLAVERSPILTAFPVPACLPDLPAAGERSAMRAAMATLMLEVDQLAHERHAAPYGGCLAQVSPTALLLPPGTQSLHTSMSMIALRPHAAHLSTSLGARCPSPAHPPLPAGAAKEAAVLAALRLLRCAMDRDAELVNAMRAAQLSGAFVGLMLVCARKHCFCAEWGTCARSLWQR